VNAARIRRRIARACIWVSAACVAIAALMFTIAPHRYPAAAFLWTDVTAILSIINARIYLHRTGAGP